MADRATATRTLVTPSMLGLHLLLVVMLVGTGIAGWWQWSAWQDAQRADVSARAARDPVPLADALGPDDPLANEDNGVPVEVRGSYAPREEQFLVSGRSAGGQSGYWVLSPLVVEGTDPPSALMVVRGLVPTAAQLPAVPPGIVSETGVLVPGEEGSGLVDADRVVEAVRIPALIGQVDTDLYDAFLVRTSDDTRDGLVPVEPPSPDPGWSAGLRNLAYAAQWWLFGAFAVFLWWRTCADRLSLASPR